MAFMLNEVLDDRYWSDPEPDLRGSGADDRLRRFIQAEARLRRHVLFQTSGSSGEPRWVALSKEALRWSAARVNEHLGCDAADHWGCVLPTHHVGGYGVLARAALAGGRLSIFPGKWSAPAFAEFCCQHRVTVTSLVPAQIYDLVNAGLAAPPRLRVAVVGGGALAADLTAEARTLGWPVRASYGMTETASQIATETEAEPANPGLPLIRPWEVRVDADGRIAVRGGGLLSFVVELGEADWQLRIPFDADGWFRTGDLGRLTASRRLWVEGRAGRVVKILGELVSLDRLDRLWESAAGEGCREAVLATEPDARKGNAVVLVRTDRVAEDALGAAIAVFNRAVEPYERIEHVLRIHAIPRTDLGKVRHEEVRRWLAQLAG